MNYPAFKKYTAWGDNPIRTVYTDGRNLPVRTTTRRYKLTYPTWHGYLVVTHEVLGNQYLYPGRVVSSKIVKL